MPVYGVWLCHRTGLMKGNYKTINGNKVLITINSVSRHDINKFLFVFLFTWILFLSQTIWFASLHRKIKNSNSISLHLILELLFKMPFKFTSRKSSFSGFYSFRSCNIFQNIFHSAVLSKIYMFLIVWLYHNMFIRQPQIEEVTEK